MGQPTSGVSEGRNQSQTARSDQADAMIAGAPSSVETVGPASLTSRLEVEELRRQLKAASRQASRITRLQEQILGLRNNEQTLEAEYRELSADYELVVVQKHDAEEALERCRKHIEMLEESRRDDGQKQQHELLRSQLTANQSVLDATLDKQKLFAQEMRRIDFSPLIEAALARCGIESANNSKQDGLVVSEAGDSNIQRSLDSKKGQASTENEGRGGNNTEIARDFRGSVNGPNTDLSPARVAKSAERLVETPRQSEFNAVTQDKGPISIAKGDEISETVDSGGPSTSWKCPIWHGARFPGSSAIAVPVMMGGEEQVGFGAPRLVDETQHTNVEFRRRAEEPQHSWAAPTDTDAKQGLHDTSAIMLTTASEVDDGHQKEDSPIMEWVLRGADDSDDSMDANAKGSSLIQKGRLPSHKESGSPSKSLSSLAQRKHHLSDNEGTQRYPRKRSHRYFGSMVEVPYYPPK